VRERAVLRGSAVVSIIQLALTVSVVAQEAPVTECDTYTASPLDPQRKATAIPDGSVNPALAIPACVSALGSFPNSLRLKYQLGRAYRQANNLPEAIGWYRQAAEHGYAPAQAALGYMYESGEGTPQSYRDAVFWYSKAADQGIAAAQYNLGVMHLKGKGVTTNLAEALFWIRKAAEQGHKKAQALVEK
jgi:tetratricopeptide (TPR) repeat protein